jgi:hypothetical protein
VKSKRLRELQAYAELWQRRLGLTNWTVNLLWASTTEAENHWGLNYWHTEDALCTIKIARGDRRKEHTVIHELIHLALEGHGEAHPYDPMYERGINKLTDALMANYQQEVK